MAAVEAFLDASAHERSQLEGLLLTGQGQSEDTGRVVESAHHAAREMLLELGVRSRLARQAAEELDEEMLQALNAADRAGIALCCAVRAAQSVQDLVGALEEAHLARLAEQRLATCLRACHPPARRPARAGGWLRALLRPTRWARPLQVR